MDKNLQLDKIRGSLIGGAIGDALGFPLERKNDKSIRSRGIWDEKNLLFFSDDTQMTLYTAMGMLEGHNCGYQRLEHLRDAYIEWMLTQWRQTKQEYDKLWISKLPELRMPRCAPHTCIESLDDIYKGNEPQNKSKGCGCIMRIAPIPLAFAREDGTDIKAIAKLAGDCAHITHHHPMADISCAIESSIISKLLNDEEPTRESFLCHIKESIEIARELYSDNADEIEDIEYLLNKAILFCDAPFSEQECIEGIGGGWSADNALAMAIFAIYKHFGDFEQAIMTAINHKGNSDTVGSIAGNIIGCICGYEAIPKRFKDRLELHNVILHIADDLWRGETTKYNT